MLHKEDKDGIIQYLREQLEKIAGRTWNSKVASYSYDDLQEIAEKALNETTW